MTDEGTRREGYGTTGATYRGFLFADLRGFTAFAQRQGNAAAVELLDEYRSLVRRAVARHGGTEMSTEGDSFHVVFPSASTAVMCGMAIVQEAAQANARRPDRPIAVGVGIHAGEAIETPEGYFGAAVNLASRICAIARPGEVLITATVRGIMQASVPVAFAPRGRKRLKGIDDPVEIFAVTEGTAASPIHGDRTRLAAGAAVVAIA